MTVVLGSGSKNALDRAGVGIIAPSKSLELCPQCPELEAKLVAFQNQRAREGAEAARAFSDLGVQSANALKQQRNQLNQNASVNLQRQFESDMQQRAAESEKRDRQCQHLNAQLGLMATQHAEDIGSVRGELGSELATVRGMLGTTRSELAITQRKLGDMEVRCGASEAAHGLLLEEVGNLRSELGITRSARAASDEKACAMETLLVTVHTSLNLFSRPAALVSIRTLCIVLSDEVASAIDANAPASAAVVNIIYVGRLEKFLESQHKRIQSSQFLNQCMLEDARFVQNFCLGLTEVTGERNDLVHPPISQCSRAMLTNIASTFSGTIDDNLGKVSRILLGLFDVFCPHLIVA